LPRVLAILQFDRASLGQNRCPGDGEAKAGPTRVPVTRLFQPIEGMEDPFHLAFWYAGSVILDEDLERLSLARQRNGGAGAVMNGIVDQIAERALQRQPLANRHPGAV